MSKPSVGFIGLGIMGRPMAGHILEAGYPLTVHNRTRAKMAELVQAGAAAAETPRAVAERSEIVIVMVSDTPDVEQVVAGRDGVLAGARPGTVVVDMSTISPQAERDLDAKLKQRGCSLVDAPVSGGDVGARDATLAIMAGGAEDSVERARPVLDVMGRCVTYCGPVGCGQLTKLCNQILVSANMLGVSEALSFARKNGLDPAVMVEAVRDGAAGSWQLSNLGARVLNRDFAPGFMVDLMQKDLRIVLATAAASAVALPATSLVHQLYHAAQADGAGRDGTQCLAKVLERLAGLD